MFVLPSLFAYAEICTRDLTTQESLSDMAYNDVKGSSQRFLTSWNMPKDLAELGHIAAVALVTPSLPEYLSVFCTDWTLVSPMLQGVSRLAVWTIATSNMMRACSIFPPRPHRTAGPGHWCTNEWLFGWSGQHDTWNYECSLGYPKELLVFLHRRNLGVFQRYAGHEHVHTCSQWPCLQPSVFWQSIILSGINGVSRVVSKNVVVFIQSDVWGVLLHARALCFSCQAVSSQCHKNTRKVSPTLCIDVFVHYKGYQLVAGRAAAPKTKN